MTIPFRTIFIIFVFFLEFSNEFSFQGNRIKDLESNGANFVTETTPWIASRDENDKVYDYYGVNYLIIGSLNQDYAGNMMRVYENLPSHDIIYFSFSLLVLHEWMTEQNFIFTTQSKEPRPVLIFFGINFTYPQSNPPNLEQIKVYGKFEHKNSSLYFKIFSTGSYITLTRFGFRDFTLLFRNKTEEEIYYLPYHYKYCGIANIDLFANKCECPEGQYQASDGSCQLCDPLCKTCLGSSRSQCFECVDGAFFDGKECTKCHVSCASCFGGAPNQCSSCLKEFYVFEMSSCVDTCNSPLVSTTVESTKYCSFPCSSDEFLYPNGQCKTTCNYTYNSLTYDERKFCSYFCPIGEYYVPSERTCFNACPAGYYTEESAKYCIPCQDTLCAVCPTEYGSKCQQCDIGAILDSNGICKSCQSLTATHSKVLSTGHRYLVELLPATCDLDSSIIQKDLMGYPEKANFPPFSFLVITKDSNQYTVDLILKESIIEQTKLDLEVYHLKGVLYIPKILIPSTQLQEIAQYASPAQTTLVCVLGVSFGGALLLGSTAAIWSVIGFGQFIGYLQYININFPLQVNMAFSLLEFSTWNFLPNPLQSIISPLLKGPDDSLTQQLPQKFVEKDMTSSFIENGGGIMLVNILLLLLLICVELMKRIKKLKSRILKAMRRNLRWNLIVRTYLENAIPLTLAVLLQSRSLNFDYTYRKVCSCLSIASSLYLVVFFVLLIRFLLNNDVRELKKEYFVKKYGTLWEGISLKTSPSKYYHVIIFLRGVLLVFLIVFLENFPVLQIVPMIFYNAGLVLYLFKEAAFEDYSLNIINRIKEILILIAETLILSLTFKNGSESHYNNLGWMIFGCFVSTLVIETTYIIGKQLMNIKKIIKKLQIIWKLTCEWFKNLRGHHRKYLKDLTGERSHLEIEQDPNVLEMQNIKEEFEVSASQEKS